MQTATNPTLLRQPLDRYLIEEGLHNDLYIDDSSILDKLRNYSHYEPVPPKFEVIRRLVEGLLAAEEKVILWGTFIKSILDLQDYLEQNGIPSAVLYGEVLCRAR
jgi:hypothetical protein